MRFFFFFFSREAGRETNFVSQQVREREKGGADAQIFHAQIFA
jgi:hypothetical protein